MKIAVIPARGGSKRIPNKNRKIFAGKPIIQYSIELAVNSNLFDRVVVSTDCDAIAELAENLGAEVPFRRPRSLSDDHTPTAPVISHAIRFFETQSIKVDYACCIYATAPFIELANLEEGLNELLSNDDLDFAFPITSFPFPIFRSLSLNAKLVSPVFPEHKNTRSQDLIDTYHDAGQFYWGTARGWTVHDSPYSARSHGIVIPRHRVQDIDTLEDWERAEYLYHYLAKNSRT